LAGDHPTPVAANLEMKATPKAADVPDRFQLPMFKKANAVHPAIGGTERDEKGAAPLMEPRAGDYRKSK